jgi:hypothetical protein
MIELSQECVVVQARAAYELTSTQPVERRLYHLLWLEVGLVLAVESWVRWPGHPARPTRHERRYFVSSLPADTLMAEVLQRVH